MPAALGSFVIPTANLRTHLGAPNLRMVACVGQATVPMVHAVARIVPVEYAEIDAAVASASAGPGTRANIDEFTRTTARAIESVGGARRGNAIIILNPSDPPLIMRDTILCSLPSGADRHAVTASIAAMEKEVESYVPGYRLLREPQCDDEKVAILVEVEGARDFLPPYAGNLDIMTAAAARVGEELAKQARIMADAGCACVCVTDCAGALILEQVSARVATLLAELRGDAMVGFPGHENLALGVANSIAATRAGALQIDASTRRFGAGAGNTPTEALVAVCDKLGIRTGVDALRILDVAEEVVLPMMVDGEPNLSRLALVMGYAGVYSSFLKHACRAGGHYGVSGADILMRCGERKLVGGQEDPIIDIASELADERASG